MRSLINSPCRVPFRPILAMLVLSLMLPAIAPAAEDAAPKKPDTIAVFSLSSTITEAPTPDDPLFGSIGSESLRSLVSRLDAAAKDDAVAGVVVLPGGATLQTAQIEELRAAFDRIRAAEKPVYVHADSLSTLTYCLAAGGSRLSVAPTGDVWVTGIYGQQLYIRGLLDWLGAQPDFLTCGDYKSAAEMFMRKGPSEEAEEMYGWLYDSLFETMIKLIATGRDVSPEQARKWIDQGLYSAESAKEKGLIDAVETREQLTRYLKDEHGVTVKFDRKYAKQSGPEIDLNNPFAALQLWAQILGGPQKRRSTKDSIAIVYVDGPIMLGKPEASPFGPTSGAYSESIRTSLAKIANDPRVKAVVMRVNSPGGSATASEIILQAAKLVAERKPVVVSMSTVAASGGYYVSCAAERIFADSGTITGSIGVVAGKLATQAMWSKIGVNFEPIQRGARAGILGADRPFSEDERNELQSWMDEVYGAFKGHVVAARGEKLTKPIDDLAGGRVYSGQQALEFGLVDEIGSLQDAIAYVAKSADIERYEIRSFPPAKNFLEMMFEDLSPSRQDDEPGVAASLWDLAAPTLRGLDRPRAEMVRRAFLQLETLQDEKVLLAAPIVEILDRP